MKLLKRMIVIIVFIISFGAVFVPLSYSLRPLTEENKETRDRAVGFYAEPDDSLDVVVLGSSSMFRYINNLELWENEGLTSYNFAFPGCSIFYMEELIDEVHKTQNSEVILVDARRFQLTKTKKINAVNMQRVYHNIKYSANRCRLKNKSYSDWGDRVTHYFDIIIYHENWEKFTFDNLSYMTNEKVHEWKGFNLINVVTPIDAIDVSNVKGKKAIIKASENALRSLLEKCQKENIQIVFVATPFEVSKTQQRKSNYVRDIVEEYGFDYLDMNVDVDRLGLDYNNDFYDKRHVNVFGSEKVTKYIGDYLVEHYDFDKEHEEEVVESWNAVLDKYYKEIESYTKYD